MLLLGLDSGTKAASVGMLDPDWGIRAERATTIQGHGRDLEEKRTVLQVEYSGPAQVPGRWAAARQPARLQERSRVCGRTLDRGLLRIARGDLLQAPARPRVPHAGLRKRDLSGLGSRWHDHQGRAQEGTAEEDTEGQGPPSARRKSHHLTVSLPDGVGNWWLHLAITNETIAPKMLYVARCTQ